MESTDERMSVRRGAAAGRAKRIEFVSGNYFQTFDIVSFTGRLFTPEDNSPAATHVATLSYAAWQTDFGGHASVVGRSLNFQGHPLVVAGITPPEFFGDRIDPDPPAFWIPLGTELLLHGKRSVLHIKVANWLYLLGRLTPGVSLGYISSEITLNLRRWLRMVPAYTMQQTLGELSQPKARSTERFGGGCRLQVAWGFPSVFHRGGSACRGVED